MKNPGLRRKRKRTQLYTKKKNNSGQKQEQSLCCWLAADSPGSPLHEKQPASFQQQNSSLTAHTISSGVMFAVGKLSVLFFRQRMPEGSSLVAGSGQQECIALLFCPNRFGASLLLRNASFLYLVWCDPGWGWYFARKAPSSHRI